MENEYNNEHNWDNNENEEHYAENNPQNNHSSANNSVCSSYSTEDSKSDVARYQCEYCGRGFSRSNHYSKHLERHKQLSSSQPPNLIQAIPDPRYSVSKPEANEQKQYVIPNQSFSCNQCKQCFQTPDQLMQHVKYQHSNIYTCGICQKQFKQKYHLQSHMAQHTGQKNFSCPICEKGFARKDTLEVHLRVHSEDRHFECEVCGSKFKQKGHLTRHMNVHLERINVQCELCGKQFFRMDQYNNHMKRQHLNQE